VPADGFSSVYVPVMSSCERPGSAYKVRKTRFVPASFARGFEGLRTYQPRCWPSYDEAPVPRYISASRSTESPYLLRQRRRTLRHRSRRSTQRSGHNRPARVRQHAVVTNQAWGYSASSPNQVKEVTERFSLVDDRGKSPGRRGRPPDSAAKPCGDWRYSCSPSRKTQFACEQACADGRCR
jgi:hypothetical protein